MERRSFLTYFGVSWAATCFPLVLSACNSSTDQKTTGPSSPAASGAEASAVPAAAKELLVADLDKNGFVANEKVSVTRDPADKNKLLAVYPACTHEGAAVAWNVSEKCYVCPLHGAKYTADGKVKGEGPAKKPLATGTAKIEGAKIVVTMT
jgi:cytochrome b6-f complex iron-sulfur subunit